MHTVGGISPSSGAVTRAGGNTTEATTTSVVAVDLLTVTGLSIAVNIPILIIFNMRKTTGALANGCIGLDVNNASLLAWNNSLYSASANAAVDGYARILLGPRATNYLKGVAINCMWTRSVSAAVDADRNAPIVGDSLPTAAITDIDVTGGVSNALITVGADEMHIYTYAVA